VNRESWRVIAWADASSGLRRKCSTAVVQVKLEKLLPLMLEDSSALNKAWDKAPVNRDAATERPIPSPGASGEYFGMPPQVCLQARERKLQPTMASLVLWERGARKIPVRPLATTPCRDTEILAVAAEASMSCAAGAPKRVTFVRLALVTSPAKEKKV